MTNPKIVYGLSSTRIDDDILDEVMDVLDEICENEWALVSWRRSAGTRFLVHGPVKGQAVIHEGELQVRVLPLGQLVNDMSDSRNQWLQPSTEDIDSPHDDADRSVKSWLQDMWPEGVEPKSAEEEVVAETFTPRLRPVMRRTPRQDVLEKFVPTAKDGTPFNLFTLGTSEDDSKS